MACSLSHTKNFIVAEMVVCNARCPSAGCPVDGVREMIARLQRGERHATRGCAFAKVASRLATALMSETEPDASVSARRSWRILKQTPMKTKQNNSARASALKIRFPVAFISFFASLVTLAAAPARNQSEKLAGADPATGTWTATGSLGTARDNHTATLLSNGKVLVAGGTNLSEPFLRSAEIYDPATGTWTATGSMVIKRKSHTATLLPNGKVLVVGGYNGSNGSLRSAELYDPAAGTWTSTGSLGQPRNFHTATLLPSGKVL